MIILVGLGLVLTVLGWLLVLSLAYSDLKTQPTRTNLIVFIGTVIFGPIIGWIMLGSCVFFICMGILDVIKDSLTLSNKKDGTL